MDTYLSVDQVCELVPGMTPGGLAQLRFHGIGPKFIKPSPRKVVYARSDIEAWLEDSKRTSTREPIAV